MYLQLIHYRRNSERPKWCPLIFIFFHHTASLSRRHTYTYVVCFWV